MNGSTLRLIGSWNGRALVCALAMAGVAFAVPARAVAANAIVTENQKAGTTAWQIGLPPYKVSNDTDLWIRGYASATSINKGDRITFNITVNPWSWKAGPVPFYIDVYRIGWYAGAGGRLMKHLGPFTGVQQPGGKSTGGVTVPGCPYDPATGMIACQWTGDGLGSGSYTLDTSQPALSGTADWTSGIYVALLTTSQMIYGPQFDTDHQTYIIFTIREDARNSDILFQQAVATYQAYNNYPNDGQTGKSLYDSGSFGAMTALGTQRAVKVSFDRPYTYSDHTGAGDFLKWELYFVRWLERNGYDVTYETDVDTHSSGASLLNHKAILSAGHPEYWSNEMRNAFAAARDHGAALGFFGANSVYSQIRFEPSPVSGAPNRVIVAYKDASLDPVNNPSSGTYNPSLTTVPFRNPPVNNAEQSLVGVMYVDYFDETAPAQSYIVQNSGNWVYAGTGFVNGTSVPGILGYEMDKQFTSSPFPSAVAGTYTLLGNSPFSGANGSSVSNSSIYQASNGPGAWVFGGGTIYWSLGLDSYVPPAGVNTGSVPAPDAGIQQATANFLNLATGGNLPAVPGALSATAVSSSGINLAWSNSPGAAAILVENSTDNVTFAQIASLAGNSTSYASTGLAAGTQYYYRVRAQNNSGTSAYSNTASATTLGSGPAAPGALGATAVSSSAINLAWTNNSPDATAILVENSTNNVTFTQIASLAGNAASYANTGLNASTQYYYRVRAQNASGTSAYSNTASATTLASAPAAPGSLAATAASASQINLTWTNNSINVTANLVENSTDNVTFTQIASLAGNATLYASTGLAAGTQYYYRVRAQNAVGTSPYSNTAGATTLTLPAAPGALAATAVSSSQINLTWTNNSPNATAMLVENSTNNVTFAQIASLAGNAAAYSSTGLNAGTLYYYRVRAQNAGGTSAYSNTASATTSGSVLPAPTALAATAASGSRINLAWTNNSPTATAILVERSADSVTFAQIASLAGTAASYANTGLTAGQVYYYRVRAQNASGTSAYSNTASAATSAPAAPGNLSATAASGTAINLAWTSNSPYATAVLVERSTDNVTFAQIASLAGAATSYANTGLTAGTLYYYRVRARNAVGTSAYSNTASAITSGGSAPAVPSGVAAGQSSVSPSSQINVYWTDNSNNETGFAIFRSPDGVTFTQLATVGANATQYDDPGLAPNTRYYYYVTAYNASGMSAPSNTDWTITAP